MIKTWLMVIIGIVVCCLGLWGVVYNIVRKNKQFCYLLIILIPMSFLDTVIMYHYSIDRGWWPVSLTVEIFINFAMASLFSLAGIVLKTSISTRYTIVFGITFAVTWIANNFVYYVAPKYDYLNAYLVIAAFLLLHAMYCGAKKYFMRAKG